MDRIADKKAPIEEAVNKLKAAHKAEDLDAIDKLEEELNAAWMAASEHMYKAGQEGAAPGADQQQQQQQHAGANDGGVADAEYEEVK